ncbi:MAG TPA: hypothetical protein EYP39_05255 [Ghiorsea sp.]|nr:hypothetical protein [Ghiorsea sp.]HIP07637.1 hypothetical protein [Mariprofundaceae bacterium]
MAHEALNQNRGFTVVEMLVTVGISMFVLAGMSTLFVSQTRTAQALSNKSEVMSDLFLASQIMQGELRGAKAICWDATAKRLRYQPLSSANNLLAACGASDPANGIFQLRASNNIDKPTAYVCWDRPDDNTNCQELMREMKENSGLVVTPASNAIPPSAITPGGLQVVRTITLTSEYRDREGNIRDLKLAFKVWPRNVQ